MKKTKKQKLEEVAFTLSCFVFNNIFLSGTTQDESNEITQKTVEAYCEAAGIKVPKPLRRQTNL